MFTFDKLYLLLNNSRLLNRKKIKIKHCNLISNAMDEEEEKKQVRRILKKNTKGKANKSSRRKMKVKHQVKDLLSLCFYV